jgi:GTP-binding protein
MKSDQKRAIEKTIRDEDPEISYAEIAFTSAKEGAGLEPVLDSVMRAVDSWNFRISTGQLNRTIQDAIFSRPMSTKGKVLKVYYSTQVSARPPTFVLFCNDPEIMHFSYKRYLENQLRKIYPLPGTPIRIILRSSHERDRD